MLNAKHAKVLNNFGPGFNGCHLKTSCLLEVTLQVSVPATSSVQRPQQRGAAVSEDHSLCQVRGVLAASRTYLGARLPQLLCPQCGAGRFWPYSQAVTCGCALTLAVAVKRFNHLVLGDLAVYLLLLS